ncbi:MAG: MMPL family transporter [Hyphomicrobiales bacterium]|nr:MMPL family transporter [Hyphomicrobiales bacterium]
MAVKVGVEKLGLLCLKRPWFSALALLLITAAAVAGMLRLSVDDSLTELFRSNTAEFRQYERLDTRFPSSEYDVLVVVEGERLLERDALIALRNMVIEFQFVPATKGVISLFSSREPPVNGGVPQQLFPEELPEGAAFGALIVKARDNRIIKDRLLSGDGQLALVVIPLDKDGVKQEGLAEVARQIKATADEQLKGTGLTATLSGVPIYQLEIRNAVQHDRILFNGIGFALGALICFLFMRSLAFTVIAVAGPIIAVIWSLGLLGAIDIQLNLFLNVITPLIMVISFADSMHMVFAVRRRMMAGDDAKAAAAYAVRHVGPASFLTMLTNQVAFISLIFSDSALIRGFGVAGILSTAIVFFAVIALAPTLSAIMLRGRQLNSSAFREDDAGMNWLNGVSSAIARLLKARAGLIAALSLALTGVFGYTYYQLEPKYKLADQVPDQEQALEASGRLDQKLTGASPIHVLIEWKDGALYDERRLDAIGQVHDIVERTAGLGNVWSLHTLRRWLAEGGENGLPVLKQYVDVLPDYLTRRFITAEEDAVVVTGRVPDIDAGDILPTVKKLDAELAPVRAANPDITISVTGLPAIAARNSANMIDQLNKGLFTDILIAMLIIMVAFRSVTAGLYSLVPNLLPILAAGAMLHWSGIGLQFASIVALTVAFGLAIDNIVHYLYRQQLDDEEAGGKSLATAESALKAIGPVVILTTAVLVLGLAMPIFSALPSLRLFGLLSAVVLSMALLSVILFLPALIFFVRKTFPREAPRPAQSGAPAE